jgi:molecular chaperone GrpE
MWYEKEDNMVKKTDKGNGDNHAQEQGAHPVAGMGNAFPGNADPTKAFQDEEELPGGAPSGDEIGILKKTIKELEEKANLNYDRYLRALAEMENYKKRANRDRAELMRYAGEDLLQEILPVVDNLERTLEHAKENTDIRKVFEGIDLIYKQFLRSLEKSGVTRIDRAPCAFDPAVHQALQRVEDKSVADDTVVEILQKGYTLNGKVVRPAMVKVAKH